MKSEYCKFCKSRWHKSRDCFKARVSSSESVGVGSSKDSLSLESASAPEISKRVN